mmetsp:Transcript_70462/g.166104  ORF Transcript_70462/g.166104 Transcript_70462/m.166104 type:complete len:219 (-) Transcript_70462:288-944(-)
MRWPPTARPASPPACVTMSPSRWTWSRWCTACGATSSTSSPGNVQRPRHRPLSRRHSTAARRCVGWVDGRRSTSALSWPSAGTRRPRWRRCGATSTSARAPMRCACCTPCAAWPARSARMPSRRWRGGRSRRSGSMAISLPPERHWATWRPCSMPRCGSWRPARPSAGLPTHLWRRAIRWRCCSSCGCCWWRETCARCRCASSWPPALPQHWAMNSRR